MTVVLVGVGADEEHLRPGPSVDSDGRYEYIPIPETWSTTENRTYGNLQLGHQNAVASDVIDRIRPKGEGDEWITDEGEIAIHPIHYDPDFSAQTFADRCDGGTPVSLNNTFRFSHYWLCAFEHNFSTVARKRPYRTGST
jgi:hypothetical protein